ncbi:MAG: AraC family transcriptional regulator [Anaerolineae bacterium]|nr:AraC family transcriptional regulator [Anaerolineae bacterium]
MVTARTEADRVFSAARAAAFRVSRTGAPELVVHAGNLAHLFAPVVVSGEVLGSLLTWSAVFCDAPDLEWHERWAGELEARGVVSAAAYWRAMRRVPTLSRAQLQASLRMLRLVSGTIADLAEQNLRQAADLERMHQTIGQLRQWRQQVVQEVERYMQAHYADPIRLQDLADHVALSPSYFSQIFREEMGQSPIDRLIDLRIARAKHLLRDEGLGVTEVAGEIGYDSVSYFIRQFSARVGVTPGRWARRADA